VDTQSKIWKLNQYVCGDHPRNVSCYDPQGCNTFVVAFSVDADSNLPHQAQDHSHASSRYRKVQICGAIFLCNVDFNANLL
jgi:hypothetical protein